MDLEPSADQLALTAELRRFLADRLPRPAPIDRGVWDELASMGVLALPVAEADGGVGLGWAEAALAFQELGRAGVPGPLVSTAAAIACDLGAGAVGVVEPTTPMFVEHLDALDSLLLVGPTGVRRVDLPLDGARAVERPLDPLTPVHLVEVPVDGDVVGGPDDAALLRRHIALLAAAMQVGLGQAAVEMATRYAGERQQFGRPIGSFQAVKHLLADAAVGVEVARAAVDAAAVTADEGGDVDRAVLGARVVASAGARRAATACIQVHGGIGFTWDLDAHLLMKRALVLDQAPVTVDDALDALADAV